MPSKLDSKKVQEFYNNMRIESKMAYQDDFIKFPNKYGPDYVAACRILAQDMVNEKKGYFKTMKRSDLIEVATFFASYAADPGSAQVMLALHQADELGTRPFQPIAIAHKFIYEITSGTEEIVLPKSEFSELLASGEFRGFKPFDEPDRNLIAIATSGCDVNAFVDLCVNTLPVSFYRLSHIFLQESIVDEFDAKLRAVQHNNIKHDPGYDDEDWKQLAAVKDLGIRAFFYENHRLMIIYDTIPDKLGVKCAFWSILPYRNDAELIKLVRAVPSHFCGATLWGPDIVQNQSIAARLPCSTVWINTLGGTSVKTPICERDRNRGLLDYNEKPMDFSLSLIKLLDCDALKHCKRYLLKWLTVIHEGPVLPRNANVRVNNQGPYGRVIITDACLSDEVLVTLCIAALACGNTLGVTNKFVQPLKDFVIALSKNLPPGTCALVDIEANRETVFIVNNKPFNLPKGFPVTDKEFLLKAFMKFQYVWLPKVDA